MLGKESASKPPSPWSYVFQFNAVVLAIMAIVYHFPAVYVFGCGVICLVLLVSYTKFTTDYASLCLLFALMHGTFHDYFMEGMGICDNAFVDNHLHFGMLWCVFQLLPSDQQEWFRSSRVIRATLCFNFLNCIFGMCLPALVNYKETGILDLKYSHACTSINRLESWEYKLYGLTSLPSTIAIACYFIAGTIVVRTNYTTHISKAIWIALGIFSGSTAAYFFFDPYWVVSFYNQIKYDQLYFIVPAFYLFMSPLPKDIKPAPSRTSSTRRLEVEDSQSTKMESEALQLESQLEQVNSGVTPGLQILESDPSFSFGRYA